MKVVRRGKKVLELFFQAISLAECSSLEKWLKVYGMWINIHMDHLKYIQKPVVDYL